MLTVTGCASSRQITDIRPHLPIKEQQQFVQLTVDQVLQRYFAPAAYQALKDIPLIDGPAFNGTGYAAGVNFWANLASLITGNGTGRKVVLPGSSIAKHGLASVIHEYSHHLDDIDRDGEAEFIDHQEFLEAYKLMYYDRMYRGIVIWSEQRSGEVSLITSWFGIGDLAEQIAFVAQHLAIKGGPDYMKYVFRNMLKVTYKSKVEYTDVYGRMRTLNLPR